MLPPDESAPTEVPAPKASPETIEFLLNRRSLKAARHGEPGPTPEELDLILRCAVRVPDHGRLTPWRITVVQGDARKRLGDRYAEIYRQNNPEATEEQLLFEHQRPLRSPLVLAVSTRIVSEERIPRWEQVLSGAAVCQNILIAASALGYAAQWLSGWHATDNQVKAYLHIPPSDQVLGFVYIGTATEEQPDRQRPTLEEIVEYLD